MTYYEAISFFRARYRRFIYPVYERQSYRREKSELTDDEIFTEITAVQADLQNKYLLTDKEYTLTLTIADKYYVGAGANQIPNDILQIWQVKVANELSEPLTPKTKDYFTDMRKTNGRPYYYCYYLTNASKVFELDSVPSAGMQLTILYAPKIDIYFGAGGLNTNFAFSDYDKTAVGYGGSLKLPTQFDLVSVEGALANVLMDKNLQAKYLADVGTLIKLQPLHTSGDIPYDDSVNDKYAVRNIGDDYPRN